MLHSSRKWLLLCDMQFLSNLSCIFHIVAFNDNIFIWRSYSICKYLNAYYVWHLRKNKIKLHIHSIPSSCLSSRVGQSVQSLSCVLLFSAPWTAARQASLSITNSWSLLKLMSIESVMPSNHLILCRPLLLPSIFPSIQVFSKESVRIKWPKYWSFSFSISPSSE